VRVNWKFATRCEFVEFAGIYRVVDYYMNRLEGRQTAVQELEDGNNELATCTQFNVNIYLSQVGLYEKKAVQSVVTKQNTSQFRKRVLNTRFWQQTQ